MEILDIIKEGFIFPSQNLDKVAIYLVVTLVVGLLAVTGIFSFVISLIDQQISALGIILCILGILVSFIISGYQLGLLKSGIDQDPEAPSFDWVKDFINGIKLLIVNIVYFIIPAIIVLILTFVTNVPGNIMNLFQQAALSPADLTTVANSTGTAVQSISAQSAFVSVLSSVSIVLVIGFVLFIIFAFLSTMGQARLANTGSLGQAINIIEAYNDIIKIGVGKVIAVILLIAIVGIVINSILTFLITYMPQLSILTIVVAPYLVFFTQRATGLLYSEIA